MGNFSIAFDTIIVGALALPWVLLVIHLFFPCRKGHSRDERKPDRPKEENAQSDQKEEQRNLSDYRVHKLLNWIKDKNQTAVASVLLFALAYSLGSAVSRIAQDFFDDSDFYLHVRVNTRWFKYENFFQLFPITETAIRVNVYCSQTQLNCLQFQQNLDDEAAKTFGLQEAALLLQGTDKIERLRQFHDQIMVLRGAAFNGLIASFLCLFWWSAKFQSRLRWIGPLYCLAAGLLTSWNHLQARRVSPPYMELTFWVLGLAGVYVLRRRPSVKNVPNEPEVPPNGRGTIRTGYVALSAFLTLAAIFGWWATQVLYDQQVIYTCQAVTHCPAQPITLGQQTVGSPPTQSSGATATATPSSR